MTYSSRCLIFFVICAVSIGSVKAQTFHNIYKVGYNYYEFPGYHMPNIGIGRTQGRNTLNGSLLYTLPGPMLRPMVFSKLGLSFCYVYRNKVITKKIQPLLQFQFDVSYYHTQSPRILWDQNDIHHFFFSRMNAHTMFGFGASKHLYNNFFLQAVLSAGGLFDYKWFFNTSYLRGPIRSTSVYSFSFDLIYVVDFMHRKKLHSF